MVLGEEDSLELNHVDDDDEEDGEHRDDNDDGTIISLSLATIFSGRKSDFLQHQNVYCQNEKNHSTLEKIEEG